MGHTSLKKWSVYQAARHSAQLVYSYKACMQSVSNAAQHKRAWQWRAWIGCRKCAMKATDRDDTIRMVQNSCTPAQQLIICDQAADLDMTGESTRCWGVATDNRAGREKIWNRACEWLAPGMALDTICEHRIDISMSKSLGLKKTQIGVWDKTLVMKQNYYD